MEKFLLLKAQCWKHGFTQSVRKYCLSFASESNLYDTVNHERQNLRKISTIQQSLLLGKHRIVDFDQLINHIMNCKGVADADDCRQYFLST